MPPQPEASPADGHRAAHDAVVISALRCALRDVHDRYKTYKERSETLEAEASRKLGAHAAETAAMLRQWGSDPNINGVYVETQLQARNGLYKNMEGREADRQINNRASFEADLLSILEDIVSRDGKILERETPANDAMAVDEPSVEASQPPVQPSQPVEGAKRAERPQPMGEAKAPELDSQHLVDAPEPPAQPSPPRSMRKRQREVDSPRTSGQLESPRIKRTRRPSEAAKAMAETLGTEPRESPVNSPVSSPGIILPGKGASSRKITFEEVYQDGKAEQKHAILTHPGVPPGTWFILKCECDDHIIHFGPPKSALHGACKHLSAKYHRLTKSHKDAIEHLGWEVLGCNSEKVATNNTVFEQALRQGYVPVNTRATSTRKWLDAGTDHAKSPVEPDEAKSTPAKAPKASTKDAPITRAKGGELYYAWWPGDEKYYLCMIMPWDNSRDFGLKELGQGIHGLGLLDKKQTRVPKCYNIDCDLEPPQIVGWGKGYEDGGPKESKRVFPALFFHSPSRKNQSAWTRASFLRPFDWRKPKFDVPGYKLNQQSAKTALEAMAKARGFSSFAQFKISQGEGTSEGSAHGESTTASAQNGDDGIQEEIEVLDEDDDSSSDNAEDGDQPDASSPDKSPEEAKTADNASGKMQPDVPRPTTATENQAKSDGNGAMANGRSSPNKTDARTKPHTAKPPMTAEGAEDATKKAPATKQPNAAGALLARRSVPGKTTPAMSPPATPTGPRPGAGSTPKTNTVKSPSTTLASSKTPTETRSVVGLPPEPPGVESPSVTAISSKSTAKAPSPAPATPTQKLTAKPAQNTPATNPPNGMRIQTQIPPPSETGTRNRPSPAASAADSPASSLRSATDIMRFYLSEYEGAGTSWKATNDSERLILEIDPETRAAKTGQGQPVTLEINRARVTSHAQFRDKPEPSKHTLTLNMEDSKTGTVQEHRFVFNQGGGVVASRQARRFFSSVSKE